MPPIGIDQYLEISSFLSVIDTPFQSFKNPTSLEQNFKRKNGPMGTTCLAYFITNIEQLQIGYVVLRVIKALSISLSIYNYKTG